MAELARLSRLAHVVSQTKNNAARIHRLLLMPFHAFLAYKFERRIVLLCAGMELDAISLIPVLLAPGVWRKSMAVVRLSHWQLFRMRTGNALANNAPLRLLAHNRDLRRRSAAHSRLRIDERILFFLTGVWQLDARLAGLVEPLQGTS